MPEESSAARDVRVQTDAGATLSRDSEQYGCLFCRTGREESVIRQLEKRFPGIEAIAPVKLRRRRMGGMLVDERVSLFPGYVFFRNVELATFGLMNRLEHVLRLLTYRDGTWWLHGWDEQLARRLFEAGGVVGYSTAYFDEGQRIHILEGFLKDHEGSITRVNRRAKTAEVRVDLHGKQFYVWLGFEVIDEKHEVAKSGD
ncbi:MAG: hypothetical protein Q4C10_11530 [Clostridia bacterium]|nr:hypothetical protein [Clostridia bacterium]